jgi:predicted homoserine dehydrogenase-like protein
VNAIDSFVETNSLGQQVGLVGTTGQAGDNVWTRCERIEPDFVQSKQMYVVVNGKGYADDIDQPSDPYYFDPDTLKIDMREQRREMRLRFGSNTLDGDYYMGKVLLSLDVGDVRGTGNP